MLHMRQKNWEIDRSTALFCTPGAALEEDGIRFTAAVPTGKEASLLLFDEKSQERLLEAPFPPQASIGDLRTMKIIGLPWKQITYCFMIDGRQVSDPYARRLVSAGKADTKQTLCGMDFSEYDWQGDQPLQIPYEQAILYHLHVRNFTRHPRSKVRHKGTYLGLAEKIPYLLELGINQVKLMPVYEPSPDCAQERDARYQMAGEAQKPNYWGYGAGNYFAPRRFYAATADPVKEFKDMVKALHAAGIEVILEMFFLPDQPIRKVLDILSFWVKEYHVDGFHVMGAEELCRFLAGDPVLSRTKILTGSVPPSARERNFAECNDGFLSDMRRILKGDEGMLEAFAGRMRRNPENYGVINYLTNHDGFTLNDLVSYDNKHNEENGEHNSDGPMYNFSWNCGMEGATRKKAILTLRRRQMRNAFLLMLFSQGTPMLLAGDEFCNSQGGNNNPYCLDSEVSWLDWNLNTKNTEMLEFVKRAIAFRKEHGVFCRAGEYRMTDYRSCGYPDLSYHSSRAWYGGFEYNSRQLGMMYCGPYAGEDTWLYIAYNLHPLSQELAIPTPAAGMHWELVLDTSLEKGFLDEPVALQPEERLRRFPARSVSVLLGKKDIVK